MNLYAFTSNGPIGRIDRLGWEWRMVSRIKVATGGAITMSSAEYVCYMEVEGCCVRRQYRMNNQQVEATEHWAKTEVWDATKLRNMGKGELADTEWCTYTATLLTGINPIAGRAMAAGCLAMALEGQRKIDEADRQEREIAPRVTDEYESLGMIVNTSWISGMQEQKEGKPPCYRSGCYKIPGSDQKNVTRF